LDGIFINKDFRANPRLITGAKGVYLKTPHGKNPIGCQLRDILHSIRDW
jgi:hypothetical protein